MLGPREIVTRNAIVAGFVWLVLSALCFLLLWSGETIAAGLVMLLVVAWVPAALWWTWRAARTAWLGLPERRNDLSRPLAVAVSGAIALLIGSLAAYALATLPIHW